jgi:hypothetical protein
MSLYKNINKRKKKNISRPKSKSTISKENYANMKAGFPKKEKGGKVKGSKKDLKNIVGELKNASKMHLGQSKRIDKHLKSMNKGGKLEGPSHKEGGIPIEVEGGEYIIKKDSVNAKTLPILQEINNTGQYTGANCDYDFPVVDARKRSKKNA